ncbi:sugar kinase [Ideonella sp. A 288]|uniref:sugar kinase n=1 Tax=Ideonella sp. A 288 TaxID=1962181 RepID=UPI000B4B71A9|nr:sugar kinase [Ideonella sp. A 288]
MTGLDVVTLGEAMALFVACESGPLETVQRFDKRTAGAETNVAVGLARLGLRVGWASRLGDDSMGRFLLHEFSREGIDCSHVAVVPGARTGFMFKGRVDDGSDPPIEYHRRGSAASAMTPDDLDGPWLASARHGHLTGVFPALTAGTLAATQAAIARLREAGRTLSFDPNLRPALWPSAQAMRERINDLAARCDWVLPGLDEGRQLTGEATPEGIAAFYRAQGASLVVVKMGAEGAYFNGQQGCGHVAAWPVERVVDTVGAGDGFAVGLISALLDGRPVAEAVRRATWIGARAVQVRGDTEGLPTRAELMAAQL